MSGASDLFVIDVPMDAGGVDLPRDVNRTQITFTRLDGPVQMRLGSPTASPIWVLAAGFQWSDPCGIPVDRVYLTFAALAGGIVQIVGSTGEGVNQS